MRMISVNNVIAGEFLNIPVLLYGAFNNVTGRIKVINALQLNSFLENWGMLYFVTSTKNRFKATLPQFVVVIVQKTRLPISTK